MSLASEIAEAVKVGRAFGWSDLKILKTVARNTGGDERREIVVLWGDAIGLTAKMALRKARAAGELPSTHPPRSLREGTLQRIIPEDISEETFESPETSPGS